MFITPKNLLKYLEWRNYPVSELVKEVNKLQTAAGYVKRPMTVQAIYHYIHNRKAPPEERIYAIAAILNVHPSRFIQFSFSDEKLEKYKNLYKNLPKK